MKAVALFGAALVATLVLALPVVLAGPPLLPDPIEYLGIAWSWVSGAGFVDPVLYSYYLPHVAPPVPALVMRAPVMPALLALPLSLGAGLHAVSVLHALFAAALGAAGVFLARRLGGLPAAAAFALGFCVSYPWLYAVESPLTEATSIGVLLAMAACVPFALRSPFGAIALAELVAIGWLTRPNLALAAPALALVAAIEAGPRGALRSRPLWIALGTFVAIQQAISLGCRAVTGFPPYEHYKVLLETTGAGEAFYYQRAWVGWLAWAGAHAEQVRGALAMNAALSARVLFLDPDYHYVGWLAIPALADAFRRRDAQRSVRLFLAIMALLLLAVHFASWGAIDPRRLLLPAVFCLWLLAAGWLADAARRLARPPLAAALPALAIGAAWLLSPSAAGTGRAAWRAWTHRSAVAQPGAEDVARELCTHLDRDAIVASPHPWDLYLACGNAGWVLPRDLDDDAVLARYLDDAAPGYLLVPVAQAQRFEASPRLERVAAVPGHVLFALRDAPARSRPWRAPPPIPR